MLFRALFLPLLLHYSASSSRGWKVAFPGLQAVGTRWDWRDGVDEGLSCNENNYWLAFCSAHATRHSLFFQSRSVYSLWSLSKRRIIRIFLVNHKRTCQLAHNTRTPSFLRAGDVQRQPSFQQESSKQRHCLGWNGGPKNFDPASEPMLHISVVPGSGGMEAESDPKGTCKN